MKIKNIFEIEGMTLPAGRNTKVFVGSQADITAQNFVQGYVTIFPDGGIPEHSHENEETYTIISGYGVVCLNDEERTVTAGDCIYLEPGCRHTLKNTGNENMIMIFTYSPANIVEHWQEELDGLLS